MRNIPAYAGKTETKKIFIDPPAGNIPAYAGKTSIKLPYHC